MLNKNLNIILCLLFFIITVCGETLNKDDILELKLKKTKKCPSYSDGYINYSCQYRFYCRDEECSTKDKKTSLVKFNNTEGKIETFIPDTCTEEDLSNQLCSTAKCYDNDDCLSNKCLNRTCMVNDDFPVIQCINIENYSSSKFKYTINMSCGRADNEKCQEDDDCASRNCTSTGRCFYNYVDHKYDQVFYQVFEIGIIVFIIATFFLIICCITCCYRHKRRKTKYSF